MSIIYQLMRSYLYLFIFFVIILSVKLFDRMMMLCFSLSELDKLEINPAKSLESLELFSIIEMKKIMVVYFQVLWCVVVTSILGSFFL